MASGEHTQMGQLESALSDIENEIASAQKVVAELASVLKRAKKAAATGRILDLTRTLSMLSEKGETAAIATRSVPAKWSFDVRSYLGEGFVAELREAATSAGLKLVERDGRMFAFPLAIRLDKSDLAVRVGKKLERNIRPSSLAKQLAHLQIRPIRFPAQQFLDLLFKTYEQTNRLEWRRLEPAALGPVVPLAEIHALLTLMPGSDYPIEEFGRDLLLLDRQPDLRARGGHRFSFPGASLARERVQPVKVYDEEGREHAYLGLAFVKEA